MATSPIDLNERRRQDALIGLGVLDTLPEPVFDAITSAAAEACGVPIALVSLVDADRQWFKSNIGLPGVEQTSRDVAFCDHAIRGSELLEVPSAEHDARFAANPLVTGEPHIRFYAGAPIELPGGERVGTVCVIDREPRQLTQAQRALLVGLGRVASAALVDRQRQLALSRQVAVSEARYRAIVEDQSELISLASPDGVLSFVNQAYARHYGTPAEQMVGCHLLDFVAAADRAAVASRLEDVVAGREISRSVNRTRASSGDERWVQWTNRALVDEAGRCTAIHSVGRDVTEQHLAELRLREALQERGRPRRGKELALHLAELGLEALERALHGLGRHALEHERGGVAPLRVLLDDDEVLFARLEFLDQREGRPRARVSRGRRGRSRRRRGCRTGGAATRR